MFEMGKTKKLQMVFNIIAIISIVLAYINKRSYDYLGLFLFGVLALILIVLSILIHCIQKDIEENMKALQNRFMDEIKNQEAKSK